MSNSIDSILKSRITIVLVDPMYPGNIGSVARAMKNMALKRLVVVGDPLILTEEACRMACNSLDILENIDFFPDLGSAVSMDGLVVGTTARRGKLRHPYFPAKTAASAIWDTCIDKGASIVFGREDRGLTNEELDICHMIAAIPTSSEMNSINLSHAVMILCYEVFQAALNETKASSAPKPASSGIVEQMYDDLKSTLLEVGFLDQTNPDKMMTSLRRLFGRAGLQDREVKIIRGICRQMRWYTSKKKEGYCGIPEM